MPLLSEDMPTWTAAEATHLQMYETTSEGTPISPVMESPEALARWLADTGASAFARTTASYGAWLKVCQGADAVSGVMRPDGTFESGVAHLAQTEETEDDTPAACAV